MFFFDICIGFIFFLFCLSKDNKIDQRDGEFEEKIVQIISLLDTTLVNLTKGSIRTNLLNVKTPDFDMPNAFLK